MGVSGEGDQFPLAAVEVAIQRLFTVSLALQSCHSSPAGFPVSRALIQAIAGVEETIRGLRTAVFEGLLLAPASRPYTRATRESVTDSLRGSLEQVLELAGGGADVRDAQMLDILDAASCARRGLDALNRSASPGIDSQEAG